MRCGNPVHLGSTSKLPISIQHARQRVVNRGLILETLNAKSLIVTTLKKSVSKVMRVASEMFSEI